MKLKRIFALLLTAVLLLGLCACGGKGGASAEDAKPEYLGKYLSVMGEMMGMTLTGDEISGFDIELRENGKGVMTVDGESDDITYEVNNGVITIRLEGEEITGTIGNDLIKIEDMLGLGLTLTFAREGSNAVPVPAGTEDAAPQSAQLPGDPADPDCLYGVWVGTVQFSHSEGDVDLDGTFDATAYLLYDEDRPYFEVYLDEVDVPILSMWGEGDLGGNSMTPDVEDGDSWILDRTLVHDDAWYLMPVISTIDGSIPINYAYEDPDGEYTCDISINLTKDLSADLSGEEPSGSAQSPSVPAIPSGGSSSEYGKSVAGADGIVPADRIMEAAMIIRGGFKANHFFSYEEIYELMGGVHGKPTDFGWDEATRTHRYEWYPDNNPNDFFSAQFVVVDGVEMGKTYQYPGDVSDTDGTPYEKKPASDSIGKSTASADGMTSKEGLTAFIKARMDQKSKKQGIEMTYEQIRNLCGCDGQPAYTDSWKADRHSYRWKVNDDIYYVADFAVLSTGDEIYISGNGPSNLEEKLGLQ